MPKIIIASGPVIVEDGRVLLNKHGDDNFYKFCGGRVENFEENLLDAARREVKEEMGFDIKVVNEEPYIWYTKKPDDPTTDIILVHYSAERTNEVNPGADIREWAWVSLNELDRHDLAPNIKPALKHFGYIS